MGLGHGGGSSMRRHAPTSVRVRLAVKNKRAARDTVEQFLSFHVEKSQLSAVWRGGFIYLFIYLTGNKYPGITECVDIKEKGKEKKESG